VTLRLIGESLRLIGDSLCLIGEGLDLIGENLAFIREILRLATPDGESLFLNFAGTMTRSFTTSPEKALSTGAKIGAEFLFFQLTDATFIVEFLFFQRVVVFSPVMTGTEVLHPPPPPL